MVDQGHLAYGLWIRKLGPELIVEVKVAVRDMAIGKVCNNLQVREEVLTAAIDDGYPLLAQLELVVIGKDESADG